MRDLILTAIVFGSLPFVFRVPAIGAYLWAWLSLMNPHKAAYGFARSFPFAQAVAIVTLLALLTTKRRRALPINAVTLLLIALMVWMTVTTPFALSPSSDAWDRWLFVLKIQVMLLATLMLLRSREELERLIWVVTFSVGFFGVKGGLWTLATGGGGRVWGPEGSMLEGNNELAVALVMVLPLMYYLFQRSQRRWLRTLLVVCMASTAFGILGTQSRGALLALCAIGLFLGLKSAHPVRTTLMAGLLLAVAVVFMPDSWTQRMDTIQDYRADTSAMSRLYTWTTLWNAAVDRPLVGAGFRADNPAVFSRYAPRDGVYVEMAIDQTVWVAHSIYFQMLGEHGFVGLLLFLALWIVTWRRAGRLSAGAAMDPRHASWVPQLMAMVQVSLIGFAVGGSFLSLAYLDLPYYLAGLVVLAEAHMRETGLPPAGIATGKGAAQSALAQRQEPATADRLR